jgi:hypothetical protein
LYQFKTTNCNPSPKPVHGPGTQRLFHPGGDGQVTKGDVHETSAGGIVLVEFWDVMVI